MTWLTPPESDETLVAFYRRVRPHGPGWTRRWPPPVCRSTSRRSRCWRDANAALGCVLVYAALFGVGEILLRSVPLGCGLLVVSGLAGWAIARNL